MLSVLDDREARKSIQFSARNVPARAGIMRRRREIRCRMFAKLNAG